MFKNKSRLMDCVCGRNSEHLVILRGKRSDYTEDELRLRFDPVADTWKGFSPGTYCFEADQPLRDRMRMFFDRTGIDLSFYKLFEKFLAAVTWAVIATGMTAVLIMLVVFWSSFVQAVLYR